MSITLNDEVKQKVLRQVRAMPQRRLLLVTGGIDAAFWDFFSLFNLHYALDKHGSRIQPDLL